MSLVSRVASQLQGDGSYEVIRDFVIDDWLVEKLRKTEDELRKERDCVGHLVPGGAFAGCEITIDTMLPGEN